MDNDDDAFTEMLLTDDDNLNLAEMFNGHDVYVAEKHLKRGALASKLLQVLRVSQEEAIVIAFGKILYTL